MRLTIQLFLGTLVTTLAISNDLSAQTWQSVGGDLNGVDVRGERIVAVGRFGAIMRSTDAGLTWTLPSSGTSESLLAIDFFDELTGIAAGADLMLRTTDGGVTWSLSESITGFGVPAEITVLEETGYLIGVGGGTWRTTNRGATWAPAGALDSFMLAADFATADIGAAVGTGGRIWRTADSGRTWNPVFRDSSAYLVSVDLDEKGRGIALAQVGASLRTDDGGATWFPLGAMDISVQPVAIDRLDSMTYTAVGATGAGPARTLIARSIDGGATWQPDALAFTAAQSTYLADVEHLADGRSVAVGTMGTIAIENGDGTWDAASSAILGDVVTGVARLVHPEFASADTAVIANNILGIPGWIRSTDGGITWTYRSRGTSQQMIQAHFSSPTDGVMITSSQSTTYTTADAGLTWQFRAASALPGGQGVWETQFLTPELGFMAADQSVLRTSDGGVTWRGSYIPWASAIPNIHFVDGEVGFVSAYRSSQDSIVRRILRTDDGGTTWTPVFQQEGSARSIGDVAFTSRTRGFVTVGVQIAPGVGEGLVYSATDGGLTWDSLSTGSRVPLAVEFFNEQQGLIVGSRYLVMATSDGGATWALDSAWSVPANDRYAYFNSIGLSTDRRTLLATGPGVIARAVLDEPIVASVGEPAFRGVAFSVRAVPNPVDGSSVTVEVEGIRFDGEAALVVTVSDNAGRTMLRDGRCSGLAGGGTGVTVDTGELAAGAYVIGFTLGGRSVGCPIVVQ